MNPNRKISVNSVISVHPYYRQDCTAIVPAIVVMMVAMS